MTTAKAFTARFTLGWRQRDRDASPDAAGAVAQAMRNASPEDWARYGGGLVAPDLAEQGASRHAGRIDDGRDEAGHDLSAAV